MSRCRLVLLGSLLVIWFGTTAGQTEDIIPADPSTVSSNEITDLPSETSDSTMPEAKLTLMSRTTAVVSSPIKISPAIGVSCKVEGTIEDGVCKVVNKLADGTCQVIETAADGVCEVGGALVDLTCHLIGAVKSICPTAPPESTPNADTPANTAKVTPAVTPLFKTVFKTIINTPTSASETVTTSTSPTVALTTTQYPDTTDITPADPSTVSSNEITDIPSETSDWTMPEYSSPTPYNNVTGFFPGYPNYTTTGRCGAEPLLCCPARDDSCRRTNCFCDEFCNRLFSDCCQDYFDACHGGHIVPYYTGTGPLVNVTFPGSTVVPTPGTTPAKLSSTTVQPTTGSNTDSFEWTTDQSTAEDCIPTEPGRKFPTMCSGQRKNVIRNCDLYGCGNYGGPRGRRYLKGVDIVCRDGFTVYAPFNGTIQSVDMCYGDIHDRPSDDGFTFIGSGLCVRIFNVKLDEQSGWIQKGCRLGTMVPMRTQYPLITSHIHIQKCDLSDPTGLISEVETHHACTDPVP